MCFGVPLTTARTRWMFGLKRRLVRRCENDTFLPKPGRLAQMSQTAATGVLLKFGESIEGRPTGNLPRITDSPGLRRIHRPVLRRPGGGPVVWPRVGPAPYPDTRTPTRTALPAAPARVPEATVSDDLQIALLQQWCDLGLDALGA